MFLCSRACFQDAKLVDPQSRYYKQPLKYAVDCFAYYNCYKCKQFYFGGRRDCEQNAAAENRPEEEFVCYSCADLKSVQCKNAEHRSHKQTIHAQKRAQQHKTFEALQLSGLAACKGCLSLLFVYMCFFLSFPQ